MAHSFEQGEFLPNLKLIDKSFSLYGIDKFFVEVEVELDPVTDRIIGKKVFKNDNYHINPTTLSIFLTKFQTVKQLLILLVLTGTLNAQLENAESDYMVFLWCIPIIVISMIVGRMIYKRMK